MAGRLRLPSPSCDAADVETVTTMLSKLSGPLNGQLR